MLVKCPYCSYRGRPKQLPIHEKNCIYKKKALKKKYNGKIEQSLEYRLEKLKGFPYDISEIGKMTDIGFNDLLARLQDNKQREDKELADKAERRKEYLAQKANDELEKEFREQEEAKKREIEESNRLEQFRKEQETLSKIESDKEKREKIFDEQRKKNEIPEPVNEFEDTLEIPPIPSDENMVENIPDEQNSDNPQNIDKPKKKRIKFLQGME